MQESQTVIVDHQLLEDEIEDTLTVSSPSEGFVNIPDKKGSPVPDKEVLRNIRDSFDFKFPILEPLVEKPKGSFIFIAGGPTLLQFIDEIRDRSRNGEFIVTSNHTYDFLIDNDIIPNMQFMLDPKEIVGKYVQKPDNRTLFVIATSCNKNVIQGLIDKGITNIKKQLIGYGIENDEDIKLQRELYPQSGRCYNTGGTMTPLRAMSLAFMLGYETMEYYGFDSCFADMEPRLIMEDNPRYEEVKKSLGGNYYTDPKTNKNYVLDKVAEGGFFYAYTKKRIEDIQVAMTGDGRRFLTCPVFAHQAKQFKKWVDRYWGKMKFIVHGDSLTSHLLEMHKAKIARDFAEIGDRRWTEKYKALQIAFHKDPRHHYGFWGGKQRDNIELMGRAIVGLFSKTDLPIRILDYGCGEANLEKELTKLFKCIEITNYDPFIEEYSKEPEGKYDIVACLDVMEHVEAQCISNTLKFLEDKTKFMVLFSLSTVDAKKELPDGRNAHITQRSVNWWKEEILKYFDVIEGFTDGIFLHFLCQGRDIKKYLKEQKKDKEGGDEDL